MQQREAGYDELVVNLPDRRLNTIETTGGATSVLLRCVDKNGRETIRQRHDWPPLEEYGHPSTHVHQPAAENVLDNLHACRMTGRGINFEGRVRGRLRSSP